MSNANRIKGCTRNWRVQLSDDSFNGSWGLVNNWIEQNFDRVGRASPRNEVVALTVGETFSGVGIGDLPTDPWSITRAS
jgi:hypothetical protein